jgi:predicted ArsR family transcriptional regulator
VASTAADSFERLYETARALGEETRFRIYRRIWLATGPIGVSDIAEQVSLHPNAVRAHLARLEQAGLVSSRLERPGGAGRPRRIFEPSAEPVEVGHPAGSARSLLSMMSEAVDALPADRRKLVAFGRAWARRWAGRRKRGNGRTTRSPRGRLQLLNRELLEWGWRPSAGQTNGRARLTTERCLFHDRAAGDHGRCCALEEGLLRGLTEALLNGQAREVSVRGCRLEVRL